jgi:hypothetical protein
MKKIKDPNTGEEKHVPITTNPILTQKLTKLTPQCSLGCALTFLFTLIVLFLALGIPLTIQSYDVNEVSIDYTNW